MITEIFFFNFYPPFCRRDPLLPLERYTQSFHELAAYLSRNRHVQPTGPAWAKEARLGVIAHRKVERMAHPIRLP
jgi:hypothetical protein